MNGTCCRHEYKFDINLMDMTQLRSVLSCAAKPDIHAVEGNSYIVRSLYFDNFDDKALKEKLFGLDEREKFRLRIYNNEPSFIRLEKKSKKRGRYCKESIVVSEGDCRELMGGNQSVLKANGSRLAVELYHKMNVQLLKPKYIVEYTREAYTYPAGNVRITLDSGIRAAADVKMFLEPSLQAFPIIGRMILEVKFDCFMPDIMSRIIALRGRQAAAFSKYTAARLI